MFDISAGDLAEAAVQAPKRDADSRTRGHREKVTLVKRTLNRSWDACVEWMLAHIAEARLETTRHAIYVKAWSACHGGN